MYSAVLLYCMANLDWLSSFVISVPICVSKVGGCQPGGGGALGMVGSQLRPRRSTGV